MNTEAEFGPWIENVSDAPCPIPDVKAGDYEGKWGDGSVDVYVALRAGELVYWNEVTHYRLRKPTVDWKAIAINALSECEEYFDNRADADCDQDGYIPNKEMRLLGTVREALQNLEASK